MSRRKGERPVTVHLDTWSSNHPVYRTIRDGDHWFDAWMMQKSTSIASLSQLTGIPGSRLFSMPSTSRVSMAEVDALARAWVISSSDLIASIGDQTVIIE
ncbi:hypothetical protein NF701_06330 [Sphingomonadaceae bacterium OTU29THOMA1]|nr:hypothetical protein NF701_06330 [Sphingomonadaceae bacterium OTU29THOMA1]